MSAAETPLTERDREVMRLLAQGLTDAEIAAQLNIIPQSLYNRISRMYRKLKLPRRRGNRGHLILWAVQHGYVAGEQGGAQSNQVTN